VLTHLAHKVQCRGLFATHYHTLAASHAHDPHVAVKHMACAVGPTTDGGAEQVID
jgi:DNA mismatch repair protein MSH6